MARPSLRLPVLLVALGAAVALLVVVVGAGIVLGGSRGGDHEHSEGAPEPTSPNATAAPTATTLPQTEMTKTAPPLPVVALQAAAPGKSLRAATVAGLESDGVVRIQAAGFEPFETGFVEHCLTELGRLTACTARFPVQMGEDGGADLQYLLNSSSVPGGCMYGWATCTLELVGAASGRRGQAQTVVGESRQGQIAVEPRSGLSDGQTVTVEVTGFPADTSATALLCAPLGGYDVRHCDATSAMELSVGTDGRGATELKVRTGRLGTAGNRCGPRDDCGVHVVTSAGFVAAPVVPLQFSLGPGASYNGERLAVGLGIGVLLLLIAVVVVRQTDWTKPTEAATPEVDAADLETEKSLDELFGTDEEIDARDPIAF